VLASCLTVAVVACLAFAAATGFGSLTLARALMGAGVGACLMAPLTAFQRWFDLPTQLRASPWILMAGSFGMLGSTLPVQLALPIIGWRGVFVFVAAMFAIAIAGVLLWVPSESRRSATAVPAGRIPQSGYRMIWRQPTFRLYAGLGFVNYGGMIALQTLWIGPWLVNVGGQSAQSAAAGLFVVNGAMLAAFLAWGWAMPRLLRGGWGPDRLIVWGAPLSLLVLAMNAALGANAGAAAWALYCVSCTFMSHALPLVGRSFDAALAGRAMSAFNLVLFLGVFAIQWGFGLAVEAFLALGASNVDAFRAALCVYALLAMLAYLHHWVRYRRALPGH
jgi:predicted MFS family arabinose efflux permease